MKRINTAADEMIADFAEMKKRGICKFGCQVTKADGKRLTAVIKRTAQGVSSYANRMYRKYGDGISVEVYYFDAEASQLKTYCTYG